jgi:hypothetical protein
MAASKATWGSPIFLRGFSQQREMVVERRQQAFGAPFAQGMAALVPGVRLSWSLQQRKHLRLMNGIPGIEFFSGATRGGAGRFQEMVRLAAHAPTLEPGGSGEWRQPVLERWGGLATGAQMFDFVNAKPGSFRMAVVITVFLMLS